MSFKKSHLHEIITKVEKIAIRDCKVLKIYSQNKITYLKAEGRYIRIFLKKINNLC